MRQRNPSTIVNKSVRGSSLVASSPALYNNALSPSRLLPSSPHLKAGFVMSGDGSVSRWLNELKAGDEVAAQKLWEGYFHRLVALARMKLRGAQRRAEDEEDAALSAFDSFCRGVEQGRFPQLSNRDELWRLLVIITARKAYDLAEREGRLKRGGGKVRDEAALGGEAGSHSPNSWEDIAGNERRRNSRPRRSRSTGACWDCSAMTSCARSPSGRWKASPTRRLPRAWVAPFQRWNAGFG